MFKQHTVSMQIISTPKALYTHTHPYHIQLSHMYILAGVSDRAVRPFLVCSVNPECCLWRLVRSQYFKDTLLAHQCQETNLFATTQAAQISAHTHTLTHTLHHVERICLKLYQGKGKLANLFTMSHKEGKKAYSAVLRPLFLPRTLSVYPLPLPLLASFSLSRIAASLQ